MFSLNKDTMIYFLVYFLVSTNLFSILIVTFGFNIYLIISLICLILLGIVTGVCVFINKLLGRIVLYETSLDNLRVYLGNFYNMCLVVLQKELYSQDEVILSFTRELKVIADYLSTIDDRFNFEIEQEQENTSEQNFDIGGEIH